MTDQRAGWDGRRRARPSGPTSSRTLQEFVAAQATWLDDLGPDARRLVEHARTSVSGGKRFRAAFCWWGHQAVAAPDDEHALLRACASLELLHASALVHDDLMDASDVRRGRPATHRAFERLHREQGWAADPEQYGAAAAILLGDLLLSWSDELLRTCGLPADRVLDALGLLRPDPQRGRHRPVPRRLRAGPGGRRRRHGDDRAALQVGEVLHRAAAAHRRLAGRRLRGGDRPALPLRPARSARPSSCATTCSASSATPTSPASRPATTWSRASAPCWSPSRSTPCRRPRPKQLDTALGTPLSTEQVRAPAPPRRRLGRAPAGRDRDQRAHRPLADRAGGRRHRRARPRRAPRAGRRGHPARRLRPTRRERVRRPRAPRRAAAR